MSFKGYRDPRTFYHIDRLHAWKNNQFFSPATVEISPINVCNQKCRYCYVHAKSNNIEKGPGLETKLFVDIIRQCGELSVGGLVFQGTGEPLLHKGIIDAFKEAGKQEIPVYLTTNGVLLNKHMADEILPLAFAVRFSNFEPDEARYTDIHDCHSSHYGTVLENIRYAVESRSRHNLNVTLISSLYLEPHTLDRMVDYLKVSKSLGIDYVIVSEAIWTSETFHGSKPLSQERMRHKKQQLEELLREADELKDEKFNYRVRLTMQDVHITGFTSQEWVKDHCDGVKFYIPIASDGEVYPCWRFWGNREYSYGNLHESSFEDILQSPRAARIYRYLSETPPQADECRVCGIVALNDILNKTKKPSKWMNFL